MPKRKPHTTPAHNVDTLEFYGYLSFDADIVIAYNGRTYVEDEGFLLDERGEFVDYFLPAAPLNLTRLQPSDFADDAPEGKLHIHVTYSRPWEIAKVGSVDSTPIGNTCILLGSTHIDNPHNRYALRDVIEKHLHEYLDETSTRLADGLADERRGD
jgi:hypothetical protein